ncbi:MAG: helix-turn-helix domain-containing protein [Pyrinomonadaceae bacterium]
MNIVEGAPASPVLHKTKASWEGLSLVHYRMRTGELPEHHNPEHLITLTLGENCNGEIRTASGFLARAGNKGSICVIPSGQSYSVRLEGESEQLAIFLDPSLLLRAAQESRTRDVDIIESCAPFDPVISNVGFALLSELRTEGLGGRLYAESLRNVLAIHLLRHYSASGNGHHRLLGGLSGQKLRHVIDFIGDNYGRDLSLAELSTVAGMSTFHFAREFKRTTGTTPHQYLMKFRVDRAKELLARSEMPLIEVGLQSGFSHQSHFTRLFRKLTGTTPNSYRLTFQT